MISIVTVTYNDRVGLKKTLDSVFSQDIAPEYFEYIIVDGASTDGTDQLLDGYEVDTVLSEADSGIFDAMNKGLSLSKGKHVLFLNAGDVFYSDEVLSDLYSASESSGKNTFIFGRVQVSSGNGWVFPPLKVKAPQVFDWLRFKQPHHQACLFPIEFYRVNSYVTKYSLTSDMDYKIRALAGSDVVFVDEILSIFDYNGVSSNIGTWFKFRLQHGELDSIYKKHNFSYLFRLRVLFNHTLKFFLSFLGKKYLIKFLRHYYK